MTDSGWNLADVFETIADQIPDELAQQQGERTPRPGPSSTAAPTASPAHCSTPALVEQDKVAQYLYNCPEYLESVFACFKAGMATVNTNYRYAADELVYLWDNADVIAVVFHGSVRRPSSDLRDRVPGVRSWLWVDDGTAPCPDWATRTRPPPRRTQVARAGPWGRSGDHLFLLYTGGTTGMPKGVMWRQDDMFGVLDANNKRRMPPEQDLDAIGERVVTAGPKACPARR